MKSFHKIMLIGVALYAPPFTAGAQSEGYSLDYSTYWSDVPAVNIRGLGIDEEGNLYVGGRCKTPEGEQWDRSFKQGIPSLDVFVAKLDVQSLDNTYLRIMGGSNEDHLKAMDVDALGNVYLSGRSKSHDFPVSDNAFHKERAGTYDVMAARLDPEGRVVYSAIFGARPMDECRGVGCNSKGYAVYVGGTHGNEFPTTKGKFSKYHGPEELDPGLLVYKQAMYHSEDCFVTTVSPDGASMEFSHLFGSNGFEKGWAADMDEAGNCYVAGYSTSKDLTIGKTAFSKLNQGVRDAFVVKFSPKGKLLASTYLGGSEDEGAYGITCDARGRIWVAGKTSSWDFPVKNPFYMKKSNGQDAFIACFSEDLSRIEFASYVGGTGDEEVPSDGLCITKDQRVVLVGKTNSRDFFTKGNGRDYTSHGEGTDVFCVVINAETFECELSTRIGGSGNDEPGAVAAGDGEFWIAGSTKSGDFPLQGEGISREGKAFLTRFSDKN